MATISVCYLPGPSKGKAAGVHQRGGGGGRAARPAKVAVPEAPEEIGDLRLCGQTSKVPLTLGFFFDENRVFFSTNSSSAFFHPICFSHFSSHDHIQHFQVSVNIFLTHFIA